MTTHPQDLPLREQARLIADGSLDPAELLEETLTRIEQRNGAFNAIVDTFADESRRMLAAAPAGPLHGVPLTMKDMFALPWRGYRNGTRHELATAAASGPFRRLRDAGAVIVGVDNMHELGLGTTGRASAYGPARNPYAPEHCAGGSSSGSAAGVAARLVAGAVGSDSGGSTRLPAGWCGIVGLKMTYGALPYDGYTGSNSTMSAPGAFGRDTGDARLLSEALLARPLTPADRSLSVGLVRQPYWHDIDPAVDEVCNRAIAESGFGASDAVLPFAELASAAGAVRAGAELGLLAAPAILPELDPITRGLAHYGMLQPARRLVRADRARARIRIEVARAFERYDLLAWPTNPAPAPPLDAPVLELPSGPALADGPNIRQAIIANLAGVPGISVPVGLSASGLPIGLQLLAPWGEEARLLDAADRIERALGRLSAPPGLDQRS
jgi:Asp-tRNA(Asn)/Glu-tRNA(Gln) amidotransferase A subunit family amidase